MFEDSSISVVVPALNEEQAIGGVLRAIPSWVDEVIVVNNGSADQTANVAAQYGARVVYKPQRGYGTACLAGIAAARDPDIVVFLDGDGSDDPRQMEQLVAPIARGEADLVIGSRALGRSENGSITLQQRLGNRLACFLMRFLWDARYTDLGPFRAVRAEALRRLSMDDRTYGWTVQMQVRAAKIGLRILEVPADYRCRTGQSKISGTIRGAIGAGFKILTTILRESIKSLSATRPRIQGERLIVFTRFPEPGFAKTRLIPALGPDGAAALHRELACHQLACVDDLQSRRPVDVEVRFAGGDESRMKAMFGEHRSYRPQGSGDLGARMNRAIGEAFTGGIGAVVVVGTDCPELDANVLEAAFDALRTHNVVLGPATDGGYYLIGLRRPMPTLFQGISWGTELVLAQTIERAQHLGISVHLLDPLTDVDDSDSLPVWQRARAHPEDRHPVRLSVIVPALDEEAYIGPTVERAAQGQGVEVIVVDGGSTDRTAAIARRCGAVVAATRPSRAVQMNLGAELATGELLLFLHADTCLPPNYVRRIAQALAKPRVAAGAFRLLIDASARRFRLVEKLVDFRSRLAQLPYGDQAIFMRATTFRRVGGFPEIPIMEDYALVRRLRRLGRIVFLTDTVRTSARRWLAGGVLMTTMRNQVCLIGHFLGIDPRRLAGWRGRRDEEASVLACSSDGHTSSTTRRQTRRLTVCTASCAETGINQVQDHRSVEVLGSE